MRLILHARIALICCGLLPVASHAADGANADRAGSLLNSFEVMCNLKTPDFDQLSGQAAAMRMTVLEDVAEAPLAGEAVQRKGWIGMLTTGPFALRIEKMSGAKGVATSCAVDGPVPDTKAFYDMVITKLRLASASDHQVVEGSHSYYWDNYAGNGMTLVLRDMERPSGHFVQVKLLNMVKSDTR